MPSDHPPLVVLDTSVVVKWLNRINEERLEQAHALLDRLEAGAVDALAPDIVKYEVGNALLKGKQLTVPQAHDAFDAFDQLPLRIIPIETNQLIDIYRIAYRARTTFYER